MISTAIKTIYTLIPKWVVLLLLVASVGYNAYQGIQLRLSRSETVEVQGQLTKLQGKYAAEEVARAQAVREAYASYRNTERREAARTAQIEADGQKALNLARADADGAKQRADSLLDAIRRLTAANAGSLVRPGAPADPADPERPGRQITALGDGYSSCVSEYRQVAERSEQRRVKLKAALEYIDLLHAREAPKSNSEALGLPLYSPMFTSVASEQGDT